MVMRVKMAAMCMVTAGMLAVCRVGITAEKAATAPVATEAALRETAWGEVVDGLQVGLLVENGKRSWRIGESFSIAFVVRNVSEQRVKLAYAVAGGRGEVFVYPYGLRVRDRDGQFGYYHLPSDRGARIPQTSLVPGESRILRSSKMTIWPIDLDRTPEPGTLMVEPGKYSLSQVDIQMDPGFWVGVGVRSTAGLTTGTVELEVLPARSGDPLLTAVATQPARSYSTADMKAALSVMGHYMQMNLDVLLMGMGNRDAWNSECSAVAKECAMLSDGAVDFLGHLATTRSDELSRRLASQLLGFPGKDRAAGYLLQALTDESAGVRSSAASALGHIGNQAVTMDLVEALKSEQDAGVQRDIMIALSWLKDKAAIPALQELRKTRSDADFQRWITGLIRHIEDPEQEGTAGRPATRSGNEPATEPAERR